jgi:hypothetical protein
MIREDFLLRMIQRLAEVIGRIMGLAKAGQTDEALRALEDEKRAQLGMPGEMLNRLPPEELARVLGPEKSMILAALLDAEADIARMSGDVERGKERGLRANAVRAAAGLPLR